MAVPYPPLKERVENVETLRILLSMLGFNIDYEHCELINNGLIVLEELGDNISIKDVSKIRADWEETTLRRLKEYKNNLENETT